jgi:hypothetical protein
VWLFVSADGDAGWDLACEIRPSCRGSERVDWRFGAGWPVRFAGRVVSAVFPVEREPVRGLFGGSGSAARSSRRCFGFFRFGGRGEGSYVVTWRTAFGWSRASLHGTRAFNRPTLWGSIADEQSTRCTVEPSSEDFGVNQKGRHEAFRSSGRRASSRPGVGYADATDRESTVRRTKRPVEGPSGPWTGHRVSRRVPGQRATKPDTSVFLLREEGRRVHPGRRSSHRRTLYRFSSWVFGPGTMTTAADFRLRARLGFGPPETVCSSERSGAGWPRSFVVFGRGVQVGPGFFFGRDGGRRRVERV